MQQVKGLPYATNIKQVFIQKFPRSMEFPKQACMVGEMNLS